MVGGVEGDAGVVEGRGGCPAGGVWLREGAEAVRVGEGFSTIRMGSRSAVSANLVELLGGEGGRSSAETEGRVVVGVVAELLALAAVDG